MTARITKVNSNNCLFVCDVCKAVYVSEQAAIMCETSHE